MSEDLLVRHCAPTLAGIKTGNLFTCTYNSLEEVQKEIRRLNRLLRSKGLRVLPLRYENNRALIYVYRPSRLQKDLSQELACSLLKLQGYPCDTPEHCLVNLAKRLRKSSDFPHEIGLFLGYPPEDVQGFIENKARHCKCIGYWKVYGDEKKAQELFAKYKKCTDIYCREYVKGQPITRLTVAL